MREIKFRAWDKEDKVLYQSPNELRHLGSWLDTHLPGALANEDNIQLMQYTGLKDKNRKEIYEGDIVKITSKFELRKSVDTGEVKWNDDLLSFEYVDWLISELIVNVTINKQEIEVIGNIYEQ